MATFLKNAKTMTQKNLFLLFIMMALMAITNQFYQESSATPLITDPKLSSRCQDLLRSRNYKTHLRQKSITLLDRTKRLTDKTPDKRQKLLKKFQFISTELQHKVTILTVEVEHLQEEMIRRGCPGLILK